jgi:hypothetical protein
MLRVDRCRQEPAYPLHVAAVGAGVDGAGAAVKAQQPGRDRLAHQRGAVEFLGERHRGENADHAEPLSADPRPQARLADVEALGRARTEHHRRVVRGG